MSEHVFSSTRFDPATPVDLNQDVEQERLSKPAPQAFFNIVACWSIRDEDAQAILGDIANIPGFKLQAGSFRLLDVDTLTRISLFVGIFNALNSMGAPASPAGNGPPAIGVATFDDSDKQRFGPG